MIELPAKHEGYCTGAGCLACLHPGSTGCSDPTCGYLPDCAGNAGRFPLDAWRIATGCTRQDLCSPYMRQP